MSELTTQERLKQAQAKVKLLNSNREKVIGDARVEEQKLKQAYSQLKELGIDNADVLSIDELKALEEQAKAKLEELLVAIEEQVATGESLIKKYNQIQEH